MAAHKVTPIEQAQDRSREAYADMTAIYQGNADAMLAWSQALMTGVQDLNAELLSFMQSRMKDGLDLNQRLAGCTSPQSFFEIQTDYARGAVQAYADEFKKLADLTAKVMNNTTAPLTERAQTVADRAKESVAA